MYRENYDDGLTAEQLASLERLEAELDFDTTALPPSSIAVPEVRLQRRFTVLAVIASIGLLMLLIGLQSSLVLAGVGGYVLLRTVRPLARVTSKLHRNADPSV